VYQEHQEASQGAGERPFQATSCCDIDIVAGSGRPPMYRLRMGEFRAMYFVEEEAVFVVDLFSKKRDSAYRQN